MKPLTIIVGRFRSGTSLVAQLVHRLGFQVSPTIPAPAPPTWRPDWEEPGLTSSLMAGKYPTPDGWRAYLKWRRQVSRATGFEGRIALKSPYLALAWRGLMFVVEEHAMVVRVRRGEEARLASMAAHPALSGHEDRMIGVALEAIEPNLAVSYEDLVVDPLGSVASLAGALGVLDDDAVLAAAALIGPATEYGDGLQPRLARAAHEPGDGARGPREGDRERGTGAGELGEVEEEALEARAEGEPEEPSGA